MDYLGEEYIREQWKNCDHQMPRFINILNETIRHDYMYYPEKVIDFVGLKINSHFQRQVEESVRNRLTSPHTRAKLHHRMKGQRK